MASAVEHLFGLGHRVLANVETPERAESLRERREAYVAACSAAGREDSAGAVVRLPRGYPFGRRHRRGSSAPEPERKPTRLRNRVSGKTVQEVGAAWPAEAAERVERLERVRTLNARPYRLAVAPRDDPAESERHLYTWEWIKPHPRRRLRRLSLRAGRGEAAYAVLAATLLRVD